MSESSYVVNIFGAAGTGKSTIGAGLFYLLKCDNYETELVTEHAKELVWEGNYKKLENQIAVFAEQNTRVYRCVNNVDLVITDSPVNLIILYSKRFGQQNEPFEQLVNHEFSRHNNINIVLNRTIPYNPNGRMQTYEEACEIDREIVEMLDYYQHPYHVFDADSDTPRRIKELITERYV